MGKTVPILDPRGRRSRGGRAALRAALVLATGLALLALAFGSGPAVPAGATAPGSGEGTYAGASDLRLLPVHELRAEGEWPPADEPWKATRALLLPQGFRATVYAKFETPNVRGLATGPAGTLYVSRPQNGAVDQLLDRDGDGFAEVRQTVLDGLDCPHGLAVSGGWLYVAQLHRVERFPLTGGNGVPPGSPEHPQEPPGVGRPGEVVADDLPDGPCADHGYRSLAVDPAQDS